MHISHFQILRVMHFVIRIIWQNNKCSKTYRQSYIFHALHFLVIQAYFSDRATGFHCWHDARDLPGAILPVVTRACCLPISPAMEEVEECLPRLRMHL